MRCFIAALVLLSAPAASAQEMCRARVVGPVQVSLLDGELGLPRRLCPRTEIALGGTGLLAVDRDAFYGQVRGSGVLWESWALSERTELFATIEAVRYQSVISSITAEHVGPGHLSIGAMHVLEGVSRAGWGVSTRLVLPTAGIYVNARPIGLDLIVMGAWQASDEVRWRAHGGGLLIGAITGAPESRSDAALVLGAGFAWSPAPVVSLVLDVDGSLGRTALLDHLAVVPAVRLGAGFLATELGATIPVAGRERADAGAVLRFIVRP